VKIKSALQVAVLGLIVHTGFGFAQSGEAETGEISTYAGSTAGTLGGHATVGADFGRAFSKYALALIDMNFAPLGGRTLRTYPGVVTTRSRLYDFNFTMHIRIPVTKRWAPYGIAGGGLLFNTYEQQVVQPGGVASLHANSYGTFGFETGAGVRYYVAEDWGVRAEYRYTFSNHDFSRFLAGVFYQFNGDFPFLPRRHGRHGHADPY
jgi:opacity protein-like surface antigen